MYPHSFKEEFSSGLYYDILLVGCHYGHLREYVDDHENTVIAMLSRRNSQHLIHVDGFQISTRGRQRSKEALLLDGRFGNGTDSVGSDVLPNILSKVLPICIPFMMVIVLKTPLFLYELQGSVVCVDDHFLPHNVMLPLSIGLHNGIQIFVIGGIISDCV